MAKQEEPCSFHHSVFSPKLLTGLKSRLSGQHAFSVFRRFRFQIWIRRGYPEGGFLLFSSIYPEKRDNITNQYRGTAFQDFSIHYSFLIGRIILIFSNTNCL